MSPASFENLDLRAARFYLEETQDNDVRLRIVANSLEDRPYNRLDYLVYHFGYVSTDLVRWLVIASR